MAINRKILNRGVGLFCTLAITCLFSINSSAQAAQRVILRYGLLQESISVEDLQNLAETGKLSRGYEIYTQRIPPEKRREFLALLRTKYPVNFVTLSRFFYTPAGSAILQDFSKVILRQDNTGMVALRTALVHGAKTSEGLSMISFIKAYPSDRLVIDLSQISQVFNNLNRSYRQTQQFLAAITPRLSSQQPSLNLPFDPSAPGNAKVQVLKLPNLKDQQRQRFVPVDIYWSTAANSTKPIIVLTHGFSSNRTDMRYIAEHLASHGYVVAAVEHIGSNLIYQFDLTKSGIIPFIKAQEFLERPQDISFVLDKFTQFNQTNGHLLQGKLATDNVTVIGHSFGGGTALSIAGAELQIDFLKTQCPKMLGININMGEGLQCVARNLPQNRYQLRDNRIKQAIALNPTSSLMFGQTGLEKVQVPTLILASSADQVTPALSEQIIGFNKISAPKWLIGIMGATHSSIKDPISTAQREEKQLSSWSGAEIVGQQAADIRQYLKAVTLAFASQNTPEANKYKIFLTPEYAQYASTQAFPMRLVTEIPPDVIKELDQAMSN